MQANIEDKIYINKNNDLNFFPIFKNWIYLQKTFWKETI